MHNNKLKTEGLVEPDYCRGCGGRVPLLKYWGVGITPPPPFPLFHSYSIAYLTKSRVFLFADCIFDV